jgi:hypothetical protein
MAFASHETAALFALMIRKTLWIVLSTAEVPSAQMGLMHQSTSTRMSPRFLAENSSPVISASPGGRRSLKGDGMPGHPESWRGFYRSPTALLTRLGS